MTDTKPVALPSGERILTRRECRLVEYLMKPGAGFTRVGETFGRPIREATEEELRMILRTM